MFVAVLLIVGFGTHSDADAGAASEGRTGPGAKPNSTAYPIKWPAWDEAGARVKGEVQGKVGGGDQEPRRTVTYPIPWDTGRAW
ncbi:hypothetical protein DWB77_07193 [Streptomyces hundungensis]|uniref:Uncharacterized protein n=1 Tax=Streptomyces hundungensis TaxID=1077946 RepID=A0A387HSB8_9ACTN|nr:hypothetical protein DWB77_07193 [Streptomyces hundungensis]